jgi:chromosome segregation ATPase
LQLKLDHSKEMQVSGVLDEEISNSLKKKKAEEKKHLDKLQKEVNVLNRKISSRESEKANLEKEMRILDDKKEKWKFSEKLARLAQLKDELEASESVIRYKAGREHALRDKRKNLELLRKIYLKGETKHKEEYKITEEEKEIAEKERHLAEHQEKVAETENFIRNLEKGKQDLVEKGDKVDEIEDQIKSKQEQLVKLQEKKIQLDLEVKIAYIEKEIAYIEKEVVDKQNEVLNKQAYSDRLQEDINSCTKAISDKEKQYGQKCIEDSYHIDNVPSKVREQYDKMYPDEKLEEGLQKLSNLNAEIKDIKRTYESQERDIQEHEREVQEWLLDFDENISRREIENFSKYFGLKSSLKNIFKESQHQEIEKNTNLELKKKRMEQIKGLGNYRQKGILDIGRQIEQQENSLLDLQGKMQDAQKQMKDIQKLLNMSREQKTELEEKAIDDHKIKISKLEEELTNYTKEEAKMWEDLYQYAKMNLSCVNLDRDCRLEYISISNKVGEYLSRKLKNEKIVFDPYFDGYRSEKSKIEIKIEKRIQEAFESIKEILNLDLRNHQELLNEKNKQKKQICQKLETFSIAIQNKKQQEVNQRKELQAQLDHLTSQSSDLHHRITPISQALEGHRQELEKSRVNLADVSQKKIHWEKQVEQTSKELQELHKQLEDANIQWQQKSEEHKAVIDRLAKVIEEQKQQQDRLAKAQEERQALEEKQNKGLEELKHKEKDLNTPIEVQYLSTELQDARTKMRNAQIELQNAMSEACEEIILQFSSNDEVKAYLGKAKVEAMVSRECIKPNYKTTLGKHRDFASQHELVMNKYEKELKEGKNKLLEVNTTIEQLRTQLKEKRRKEYFTETRLEELEKEIDNETKIYNLKRNKHDQLSKLDAFYDVVSANYPDIAKAYENISNVFNAIEDNDTKHGSAEDQLRNLTSQSSSSHEKLENFYRFLEAAIQQKKSLESGNNDTKKELEEVKIRLEASDAELIEKDKKIAEIRNELKLHLLYKKQLEASLLEATKKREAIRAKHEKTKKAMNNLPQFFDNLRQI